MCEHFCQEIGPMSPTCQALDVQSLHFGPRSVAAAGSTDPQGRWTAVPTGPGDILDLIRHGRASTRGDVLEATGLSRMTVAQRLDALLGAAMIVEGDTTEATGGTTTAQPDLQHLAVPRPRRCRRHHAHPDRRHRPRWRRCSRRTTSTCPSRTAPARCWTGSPTAVAVLMDQQGVTRGPCAGSGSACPDPSTPSPVGRASRRSCRAGTPTRWPSTCRRVSPACRC